MKNYLLLAGFFVAAVGVDFWADQVPKPGEVLGTVEYFRETSEINTIEEVSQLSDAAFKNQDPCCNTGLAKNSVWFRFKEHNASSNTEDFIIEVVNPSIELLHFYQLDTLGKVQKSYVTGATFRYGQRPDTSNSSAQNRNFLFPVKIPKGNSVWCYLKVTSEYPITLRILFFEREERLQIQQRNVDILMSVFYTFCVLFLGLIAILIAFIKQPFHWNYFIYVLLTTLFIPAHLGLGFKFIWPNTPDLQFIVPMALNILRLIFGIQFFRYYFDLPRVSPRLNQVVGWATRVFFFTFLILVVHRSLESWFFIGWVFYPFFGILLLFCLVLIGWLFYSLLFRPSRKLTWLYIIVALNVLGVAITSQQYTGIIWLERLGMGWIDLDLADKVLTVCGIANTFFLSPLVIAAFFLEMMLVFSISTRRYLRLIDQGQKAQIRLAKAREANLNALVEGAENERKRIARDLHDGACVNLAAINMKMDSLTEALQQKNPDLAAQASDIASDIDDTFKEVRSISHDLMSKTLEKTGLRAALEELAIRAERTQQGLIVHFYSNYPLENVKTIAGIHVFRVIQELTGNVLKHAKASELTIQVLENDTLMLITLEDNGTGFDLKNNHSDGIGLSNIKHRVDTLRGHFHLETAPGKGTFISIEIPKAEL
ncbi:MAG: hypothetical protein JNJ57_00925 [Saprospiraceae bacterium]|nr:hypothetical protein [Saprospiraceae bacterium]